MKKVSKNVKIVVSVIALVCVAGIAIGTVAIINKNKKNEPKENPVIINEATEAPTAVPTAVPSVITPVPTDVPEVTEAPEATETSEATEVPVTEVPAVTTEPTEAPIAVPTPTQKVKATEKATAVPTEKPTESVKATEKPADSTEPEGKIVYDENGNKYLDLGNGFKVNLSSDAFKVEDLGGIGGETTAEEIEARTGRKFGEGFKF